MAIELIDSFAHSGEQDATPSPIPLTRKWTNISGNGGYYDSTTHVRASGHAMALVGNINKTLDYVSFRVAGVAYFYPGSSDRGNPIAFLSGGTTLVQLTIEADSTLSVYAGGTRLANTGSSFVITTDVYHYYEISVQLGGGSPITVTAIVNVDGFQRINATGNSTINASSLLVNAALMNGISLGAAEGGGSTAWAADFYCLNNNNTDIFGAVTANVNFLGDVSIFALMPVQDVTVQWQAVPAVPHHYVNVNEIPPDDDTTYVFTDTVGQKETFLFQPILGFVGTIFGAQLLIYAKKDNEGSRAFQPTIGGTAFSGLDNYLCDYYTYYLWAMDTNNGVPWTPTNFNSQDFGAELTV